MRIQRFSRKQDNRCQNRAFVLHDILYLSPGAPLECPPSYLLPHFHAILNMIFKSLFSLLLIHRIIVDLLCIHQLSKFWLLILKFTVYFFNFLHVQPGYSQTLEFYFLFSIIYVFCYFIFWLFCTNYELPYIIRSSPILEEKH